MATFLEIATNVNKGLQTPEHEEVLVSLTSCTNEQLTQVGEMYKEKFKNGMSEAIAAAIPQENGKFLAALAAPRHQYIAQSLHVALQSNDWRAIADLIGSAHNDDINRINTHYSRIFNHASVEDIRADTEPTLKKALLVLLAAKRVEHPPLDIKGTRVAESTEKFHQEVQKPTEEDYFVKFFTENPFAHIRNVDKMYHQKHRQSIVTAASKLVSQEFLALAEAITVIKSEYWAKRIHDSLTPGKIDNETLIRAFVLTNDGNDLATVNSVYKKTYEDAASLATDVVYYASKDTQRIFERLCLRSNLK